MVIYHKEVQSEKELLDVYPIMKQLRPHLDETAFLTLVSKARASENYKLFALYSDDVPVSLAGFLPRVSLSQGVHVWVADLVTCEKHRSKGYGKLLLRIVEEWAREHGCRSVALSSGTARKRAHRFYEEKVDYEKASYLYRKTLA
ncbi:MULTISPECIES: GNAT family N-acetyltransferase [Bacillus]|nr:GNAT family N-acetyltransferase [Bacillus glycinifermentans]MBU8787901.1 GNAT family N-acetyltransferase [Bacillus glycinifermentans]NUJ18722.1 GNAT family N-acetyltransferase [Bacillus glycinifermentans]